MTEREEETTMSGTETTARSSADGGGERLPTMAECAMLRFRTASEADAALLSALAVRRRARKRLAEAQAALREAQEEERKASFAIRAIEAATPIEEEG